MQQFLYQKIYKKNNDETYLGYLETYLIGQIRKIAYLCISYF